jgi:hypothetical protein
MGIVGLRKNKWIYARAPKDENGAPDEGKEKIDKEVAE